MFSDNYDVIVAGGGPAGVAAAVAAARRGVSVALIERYGILGVTLDMKPEQIYRAMMEAAAFGARRIVDGLAGQGIPVTGILANGGISRKNLVLMQIYADVLQRPVEVLDCPQAAALGSAIAAYVAEADGYARWAELVSGIRLARTAVYRPDPAKKQLYDRLYAEYLRVSDYFSNENPVMAELRALH